MKVSSVGFAAWFKILEIKEYNDGVSLQIIYAAETKQVLYFAFWACKFIAP